MWQEHGYYVSVYSLHDEKRNVTISKSILGNFVRHFVAFPLFLRLLCGFILFLGSIPRIFGLRGQGGTYASFVRKVYFAFYCFFKTDISKKSILIATDPPGLWAASLISKKTNCPYIYFVREMFLSDDNNNMVDRIIKHFERKANKDALFTVEFDETRAELIQKDNRLRPEKMRILPNTPTGEAENKRSRYLREKFNVLNDKKIALYTGGIADYNLTYECIKSTETWPDKVVLVMHCWGRNEDIKKLKEYAKLFKREIYFSTDILPFEKIDIIYSSADIGFALYGDQDLNHKYAGMSSGKMFNFMKACVPLITNDTPSCKKAVEETGCGICIRDISEVSKAIRKILKNENNFRLNCQKNFSTFNFEHYHNKLIKAIEHHCYLHS